jgi:hypothetical protein
MERKDHYPPRRPPAIGHAAKKTARLPAHAWITPSMYTSLVRANGLLSLALTEAGRGSGAFSSMEGAHIAGAGDPDPAHPLSLPDRRGRHNATVNFGTDQSSDSAVVKWGQVGAESCTAHTTTATKTSIMVNGRGEYQWKAQLSPLRPGHRLLLTGPTSERRRSTCSAAAPCPSSITQLPADSDKPFSVRRDRRLGQDSMPMEP